MAPPIRVALIGLSSSAKTSWASGAHFPYLLSARGKEKFQIVALLNSSVDAAKKAIEAYKLDPSTVKAYGDPQSLADDPDVDLAVNCTRVDVHHGTILPSVKAGKGVFVEWPLAQDVAHAKELVQAAEASGSRSINGLQGQVAPVIVKLRELLDQGAIGRIVSSEIKAAGGFNDRQTLPGGLKYFTDPSVGGNVYTIGYGHLFDQVQHVLGEFTDLRSEFHLQRPQVKVKDPQSGQIAETITNRVPDLIFTTARLAESSIAQRNASVLYRFRQGQPFPGEPALSWTINGEKGEIRIIAQDGTALHATAYNGPVTIELHDFATDKVNKVEWAWESWQEELPLVARSVALLYENYAAGNKVPTFQHALKRHEQLEQALSTWKP